MRSAFRTGPAALQCGPCTVCPGQVTTCAPSHPPTHSAIPPHTRSADEEYGGGRRGGLGGGRQRADYSKPVGFVSSGVIRHGDDNTEEERPGMEGLAAGGRLIG